MQCAATLDCVLLDLCARGGNRVLERLLQLCAQAPDGFTLLLAFGLEPIGVGRDPRLRIFGRAPEAIVAAGDVQRDERDAAEVPACVLTEFREIQILALAGEWHGAPAEHEAVPAVGQGDHQKLGAIEDALDFERKKFLCARAQRVRGLLAFLVDQRVNAQGEPLSFADLLLSDQSDSDLQDFLGLAFDNCLDFMYGAPEYGGNKGLAGWLYSNWPGDRQPRGYTPEQVSTASSEPKAGGPDTATFARFAPHLPGGRAPHGRWWLRRKGLLTR